jgi:hypothetical protein
MKCSLNASMWHVWVNKRWTHIHIEVYYTGMKGSLNASSVFKVCGRPDPTLPGMHINTWQLKHASNHNNVHQKFVTVMSINIFITIAIDSPTVNSEVRKNPWSQQYFVSYVSLKLFRSWDRSNFARRDSGKTFVDSLSRDNHSLSQSKYRTFAHISLCVIYIPPAYTTLLNVCSSTYDILWLWIVP